MTFIIFRGAWQVPKLVHKTYNIQKRSGAKVSKTPAQPKYLKNTLSPKTPFKPLTTDGYHNTEKCCARIRKDLWLWAVLHGLCACVIERHAFAKSFNFGSP